MAHTSQLDSPLIDLTLSVGHCHAAERENSAYLVIKTYLYLAGSRHYISESCVALLSEVIKRDNIARSPDAL